VRRPRSERSGNAQFARRGRGEGWSPAFRAQGAQERASNPQEEERPADGGPPEKLGSSPDGISQAEAAKRLAQYGPNEIEEKKDNPFLKFLTYLWGPIPWMIEIAVVLSALAQHWPDFFIILLLLMANAVVGFWEEHQAGNAIAALKAKLAVECQGAAGWQVGHAAGARTGAGRRHPPAPGRHRARGRPPARGDPIEVDQSALTGESLARHAKARRGRVLGLDRPSGRDQCPGLRDRHQYVFRQDGGAGAGRRTRSAISSARCSRSATT
jgi:hypothetical protein